MLKFVSRATIIGACLVVGTLWGCGKKEMPSEPAVGPVVGTGEPAPKADPVLIAETANCKVYRLIDRPSQYGGRYIYLTECSSTSSGLAVP